MSPFSQDLIKCKYTDQGIYSVNNYIYVYSIYTVPGF